MTNTISYSDLKVVSYAEYGDMLQDLTLAVQAGAIKYDVLVPILRSGAPTAVHLAGRLGITNILPVQYKYIYQSTIDLVQKIEMPQLCYELPAAPKVLVVDTNTVEGQVARQVMADVTARYPDSIIDFATVCLDHKQLNKGLGHATYYARLSNESRTLTDEAAAQAGVSQDVLVFPWEDLEHQWTEIQAIQAQSASL